MNYSVGAILAISMFITGCATQGMRSVKYNSNEPLEIKNQIVVSKAQPQVWDILEKELSRSAYVINNIDKESRIINVSFASNSPSEYVDCGNTRRTYTQGGKTETYEHNVAEASTYKVASDKQQQPAFVNYDIIRRKVFLEGRSNVHVAPDEKDNRATLITVNTQYILTLKMGGESIAEDERGLVAASSQLAENSTTYVFNSNNPEQFDMGQGITITCFSKGKIEKDILDMAKGERNSN